MDTAVDWEWIRYAALAMHWSRMEICKFTAVAVRILLHADAVINKGWLSLFVIVEIRVPETYWCAAAIIRASNGHLQ